MKQLTTLELSHLCGGWANPEECQELQNQAHEMEQDPNTTREDWDKWADQFFATC